MSYYMVTNREEKQHHPSSPTRPDHLSTGDGYTYVGVTSAKKRPSSTTPFTHVTSSDIYPQSTPSMREREREREREHRTPDVTVPPLVLLSTPPPPPPTVPPQSGALSARSTTGGLGGVSGGIGVEENSELFGGESKASIAESLLDAAKETAMVFQLSSDEFEVRRVMASLCASFNEAQVSVNITLLLYLHMLHVMAHDVTHLLSQYHSLTILMSLTL